MKFDFKQALVSFEIALSETSSDKLKAKCLNNIGCCHIASENFFDAAKPLEEALAIKISLLDCDIVDILNSLFNLAALNFTLYKLDQAEENINQIE